MLIDNDKVNLIAIIKENVDEKVSYDCCNGDSGVCLGG